MTRKTSPTVLSRAGRTGVVAGALLILVPVETHADQFVLFDATFTYTWDDAINSTPSKSHYYVNEGNWLNKGRPANWMSPVNYRDGKVHIRAEVLEKPPGDQQAGWALCYVANVGSYGCPYTDYYTKTGLYERDVDMRTFYNNATIQWDRGIKQVDLVYTIDGSGSGHITNFPEKKDLTTPTKVRITMVQVSSGGVYDPTMIGTDGGTGSDGGSARDAEARDATDAMARPDVMAPTGGAGSAGSAGTGGAAGTGGTTGGATGSGGANGSGGAASGGTAGTGARGGNGGSAAGGSPGAGGSGNLSAGAGGTSSTTPRDPASGPEAESLGGCNCSIGSRARNAACAVFAALALFVTGRRRHRSRRSA